MYEKHVTDSGHEFFIRKFSSDIKAINEVVVQNRYERRASSRSNFPDFQIRPGDRWIDVGGNIGAFSVHCIHKGASVESFEPDPENFSILEMNTSINLDRMREKFPDQIANCFCLGLHSGPISSAIMSRNSARGNFWRNSIHKKWRGGELVKVDLIPFDSVIGRNPEKLCVKIDAEGSEMPILESFGHIRFKKLVFEWSFDIDPSITRFLKVIEKIKKVYPNVTYQKFNTAYKNWEPSWFPACRTVWAM